MSVLVHDLSVGGALDRMADQARRALARYDVGPATTLAQLSVSENVMYDVRDPDSGLHTVLRLHRQGYHDRPEIESELAWLDGLRDDAGVRTPKVIPTADGQRVVSLDEPGSAEPRYAVMFEFLPGSEPAAENLLTSFELLGGITARMHDHVMTWRGISGVKRWAWDYDCAFGTLARWGRWQAGIGVGPAEHDLLTRLESTVRRRIDAFGVGVGRYGLIHSDMRAANLLLHDGDVAVIDFDDCGWGWFLYDLAAAVSFIEHEELVGDYIESWLRGYRAVRPLSAQEEAEIPTFIMMRRLILTAWIGSHTAVDFAQKLGAGYTRGTCDLAEDYLRRFA